MSTKKVTDNSGLINFYELPEVKSNLYQHYNPNFDKTQIKIPARIGVIAASGGGKTQFVMNFIRLMSMGQGTFSHIHVVHKIDEDLYDFLRDKCKDKITFYKRLCDLPEPKDLKPKEGDVGHQLVIFDDLIAEKNQKKIEDYFIYGRKINNLVGCTCIYISQRYFAIPKTIRAQFNYLILLKIREKKDVKLILAEISTGLDMNDFMDIYNDATKEPLNFLKVDCTTSDNDKLLSKNFTQFYEFD